MKPETFTIGAILINILRTYTHAQPKMGHNDFLPCASDGRAEDKDAPTLLIASSIKDHISYKD
jgi:hypothetical protein